MATTDDLLPIGDATILRTVAELGRLLNNRDGINDLIVKHTATLLIALDQRDTTRLVLDDYVIIRIAGDVQVLRR